MQLQRLSPPPTSDDDNVEIARCATKRCGAVDADANADADSIANALPGQSSVAVDWHPVVALAGPACSCGIDGGIGQSQRHHCSQEGHQEKAREEGWCCILFLLLLRGGRAPLTSQILPRLSSSQIQPAIMTVMASRRWRCNPRSVPEGTLSLLLLWLTALPPP